MRRLPLLAAASALVLLTGCKATVSPAAAPPASSHSAHKTSHASGKATEDTKNDAHPAGIGTGSLRLLIEPADGLSTTDKLITGAKSSVDLTMYEVRDTTAENDLAADAARGVDVRVLLDRHLEESRNAAAYSYLGTRDSTVTAALEQAAKRGVDVTVVMTADSEWNTAFAALRRAGVHVHTFPDSSSALYIHAKAVVADAGRAGQQVFAGSENFSVASLDENRELGIRTANAAVISAISATIAADYASA